MFYFLHSKCLMKCLNKFFIDFCHYFCVDNSGNPHRSRLGKETMTNNTRKERMTSNPTMPKRGKGCRNPDGVQGSQAAQSQVIDPICRISTMWLRSNTMILLSNITMMVVRISTTSSQMPRRLRISLGRMRLGQLH